MYDEIFEFIKILYKDKPFIPLHEPVFSGNEKKYVNDCIDSGIVSSIGSYVERFEKAFAKEVGSKYAIATVNGTSALHIALHAVGVEKENEVITQALSFVATCNAIDYLGAKPVFVDVDLSTMGMSSESLHNFLNENCEIQNQDCINKTTGKVVKACVPMHTFGHPCQIDKIKALCDEWNINLVEDAAESLGSYYKDQHTGTFGDLGIFSFNGNKIITAGGGGVVVTNDESLAKRIKHLSTTAKVPHPWEYEHDEVGYNYRMPNLNAALLLGQLEQLEQFVENKRDLALEYDEFFKENKLFQFVKEPLNSRSNYWLNALVLKDVSQREPFLLASNEKGVMTRPIWKLMSELKMYASCQCMPLPNSKYLEERVINIPSGVRLS